VTTYEFFGQSPLRSVEIVRTYLCGRLLIPAVVFGPIGVSMARDQDPSGDNAELVGMFRLLGVPARRLFHVYDKRWRAVRKARHVPEAGSSWCATAVSRLAPSSWPDMSFAAPRASLTGPRHQGAGPSGVRRAA
jgi:hypothetical protein